MIDRNELKEIEEKLKVMEKPAKRGPYFQSIDHLQPNTFIEDAECPESWSYNGRLVSSCQTDLRQGKALMRNKH